MTRNQACVDCKAMGNIKVELIKAIKSHYKQAKTREKIEETLLKKHWLINVLLNFLHLCTEHQVS